MSESRRRYALAAVLAFAAAAPAHAQHADVPLDEAARAGREAETQRKLAALRAEIRTLAEQRRTVEAQKGGVAVELREREMKIAAAAREVRAFDATLADQQDELTRLETQRATLEAKLRTQRAALAALLRSAYALGRHEELKLLLQQDDVGAIARVLAYHRYFQRARVGRIDALLGDLSDLARVQDDIVKQNAAVAATRAARQEEVVALERDRAERMARLTQLNATLNDQQARLAALGKDEQVLAELLEKLRDVFADIPKQIAAAEPFERRRGRLVWPLAGKVAVGFGASDDSGRAISGIVIAAKTGSEVHAVSHGRVAYADWLKGYGLLLILDHGDGYMSLYGYNETLLRDVGDWVDTDAPIATAGSSGGRKTPSLYFELRQKGRPIDPRGWLTPPK